MAKNNTNAGSSKIAELKKRQHQHDVKIIKTGKTITAEEWANIIEVGANLTPKKFNITIATAIAAFWAAFAADKMTEQYGASHESHFGFTTRPIAVIDEITEIFNNIDNMTFFAATNGDNEKFNIKNIVKGLVGDEENCVVSVKDIESLNWLFRRVEFFATDIIRDQGYDIIPKFYEAIALGEVGIKGWLVPAEDIVFTFKTTDDIIIEDDGLQILFQKAIPTTDEICYESDSYSVVSVHDAIKNIMTDYFLNHLSEN